MLTGIDHPIQDPPSISRATRGDQCRHIDLIREAAEEEAPLGPLQDTEGESLGQ